MSLIEQVQAKCREVEAQVTFINTLAGKASDPKWVEVDPGYTRMREMAKAAANRLIVLSQELRALMP